jgi:hypothetical protein
MGLTRSLALGLLCALPLFNAVLAAPTLSRDDAATPRPAIAIKLNKSTTRARSLAGADLVEDLIRKAQSGSGHAKRDAEFNVFPLITSLTPEKISEMVQRATTLDPTYEPTDFGSWYRVQFSESTGDEDAEIIQLLNNLAVEQEVASCQRLVSTKPPAVQPNDDPLFPTQGYLTGDGVGINAVYAWGFPGGNGAGTTIIDVEAGWKLTHEDLV